MGLVRAFRIPGCRLWIYTGDHGPPHFHVGVVDEWEIRVYFMQEPPEPEVIYQVKRVPGKTVRRILMLTATHRAELLDEWERSQADE